ncbi:MAG: response regulator [Bauldia sp.]
MAVSGAGFGLTTTDGRRPRVAIAGGTPASAMVAGVLVGQFGCLAITSRTGAGVLALIGRDEPIDLVVMDLFLPDTDGLAVAERLRALGASGAIPMIALVDSPSDFVSPRGGAAGFVAAVKKPYSPRELYAAMHIALRGPAVMVSGTA